MPSAPSQGWRCVTPAAAPGGSLPGSTPKVRGVVGVDSDVASLVLARSHVTGELVEGDVHRLPVGDARFHVTVAMTVCEFAADPSAVIAELSGSPAPVGAW